MQKERSTVHPHLDAKDTDPQQTKVAVSWCGAFARKGISGEPPARTVVPAVRAGNSSTKMEDRAERLMKAIEAKRLEAEAEKAKAAKEAEDHKLAQMKGKVWWREEEDER